MKKALAILLMLAISVSLAACSGGDPATPAATPAPAATPQAQSSLPTPEPLPAEPVDDEPLPVEPVDDEPLPVEPEDEPEVTAPAATPAPQKDAGTTVKIKDYVLEEYTDENLGISLQYPSHWTVEPGTNTLSFTEPTSATVPMRLAITSKDFDGSQAAAAAKKEFSAFMKVIKGNYTNFKANKVNNKLTFMNRSSLSNNYVGKLDGTKVRGFVIMSSVARLNKIYALHFYAPQAKFKNMRATFQKILYSVKPLAANASPAATA